MKPIKQVGKNQLANVNLLPGESGAEDSLWAYRNEEMNTFTSRWKLTWRERISILFGGSVWFSLMGRGHPPIRIDANEPDDVLN